MPRSDILNKYLQFSLIIKPTNTLLCGVPPNCLQPIPVTCFGLPWAIIVAYQSQSESTEIQCCMYHNINYAFAGVKYNDIKM
jgi:hypothetical protein